jgi:hypothetical protein
VTADTACDPRAALALSGGGAQETRGTVSLSVLFDAESDPGLPLAGGPVGRSSAAIPPKRAERERAA